MGAVQSSGVDVGGSSMGYQVLRVYPNSPGSRAGLKAYFDFIVAIGNTRFNRENGALREILKASVDQKLKMIVFNTRTKSTREVEIFPSTSWGGNGLLGVSIKHASFDRADERVWHVVEVEPGSPAHQAGFKAKEDYVIGSDSILQENDDLYNLVEAHEGKALKLFVYNVTTDNCREIICHPNSKWGGKGYLGCEFGHGLLHRIPYSGGDEGQMSLSSKASLLRNEQPTATQQMQHNSFQNPIDQQQFQKATQPGQQLFQQALFSDQRSPQLQQQQPQHHHQHLQQHQQPLPQQASAKEVLPPLPTLPQTFAQLANAQHQSPQYPTNQQQQQQQQQQSQQFPQPTLANQTSAVPQEWERLQSVGFQPFSQQQLPPGPLSPSSYSPPPPPPTTQPTLPQTFAQLADAQYQSPQYQPNQQQQQQFPQHNQANQGSAVPQEWERMQSVAFQPFGQQQLPPGGLSSCSPASQPPTLAPKLYQQPQE